MSTLGKLDLRNVPKELQKELCEFSADGARLAMGKMKGKADPEVLAICISLFAWGYIEGHNNAVDLRAPRLEEDKLLENFRRLKAEAIKRKYDSPFRKH